MEEKDSIISTLITDTVTKGIRVFALKIAFIQSLGGVYRGLQEDDSKDGEDMILFDDANGSTKALPLSKVTEKNVKAKLAENL